MLVTGGLEMSKTVPALRSYHKVEKRMHKKVTQRDTKYNGVTKDRACDYPLA